jgi:lipoprotein-anchoring transpeptidase ErfK/SrfK
MMCQMPEDTNSLSKKTRVSHRATKLPRPGAMIALLLVCVGATACAGHQAGRPSGGPPFDSYRRLWTVSRAARPPELVPWIGPYRPGDIVIVNNERALYLMGGGVNGLTLRYPVAIGTHYEVWTGLERVTSKKMHPTWVPVTRYRASRYQSSQYPEHSPDAPSIAPIRGGAHGNPLGVRALYLGATLWRIHGTNAPQSIGQATSDGCIRMHNDHVADLYDRVEIGALVFVVDDLSDPPPRYPGHKREPGSWRW